MHLLNAALDLLFPPKCPFCRCVVDREEVCPACQASLPWAEGDGGVKTGPDDFSCAAPLFYEGAVRGALLRLKFEDAPQLARPIGALIARCASERYCGGFDVVTWVPVGPKRLRRRGYDQARLLAEAACRLWDTRPERLLVKPVDNPAQSGLPDAEQRRANVLGAYDLAPEAQVSGRHILLIDDICTTGATLRECARVLKDAGADTVVCAAAALTRLEENGNGGA